MKNLSIFFSRPVFPALVLIAAYLAKPLSSHFPSSLLVVRVSLFLLSPHLALTVLAQDDVKYLARVGLYSDDDYIRYYAGKRDVFSAAESLTESGYIRGFSNRYRGDAAWNGQAAWVASASTGLTTRIGLYASPEFTDSSNDFQYSSSQSLTESGYVLGHSNRYNGASEAGQAAWIANASTGLTRRVGFYYGPEFTSTSGNTQFSRADSLTESGFVRGASSRFNGATDAGQAAWVTSTSGGKILRIGLYAGPEFTNSSNNFQNSSSETLTESGYLLGHSNRYNEGTEAGQAAWTANASTGLTTRIGLYSGSEFTSSDSSQFSVAESLTESGYLSGYSTRYVGGNYAGEAVWVARASTGRTTRIGLYSGPEFTSTNNDQFSGITSHTESGYLSGYSLRSDGSGEAVWIASASSGLTTRVGLYSGQEFTSTDNEKYSTAGSLTESGYLSGSSLRFNGSDDAGQAAWVAKASSGVTTRIGLYSGQEFTSTGNEKYSAVESLTESGYLSGSSLRFNGSDNAGQAAWVAEASTGVTTRIGFSTGSEFTATNNTQFSAVQSLTGSGFLSGYSLRYNGANEAGQAAWVATASTGGTTRIGLSGKEFTRISDQTQYSSVDALTESGYMRGHSLRFATEDSGQAAWVATASTGNTARLGLYTGNDFKRSSDDSQYSRADALTESGYLSGHSLRYNGSDDAGQAAWVATASSGATTRVGLSNSAHTGIGNYQYSTVTMLTEAGLAAGYSERYNGDYGPDGQTAWIFDLTTDTQITFDLSVRPSDGYSFSTITGITDEGLVYGYYTKFSGRTDLGDRAFVWNADFGTQVLDLAITGGVPQYGWDFLRSVTFANNGNLIAGSGQPDGMGDDSQGIYLANVVPEPSVFALFALGASALLFQRRRSAES